jgi:hypothetical protein
LTFALPNALRVGAKLNHRPTRSRANTPKAVSRQERQTNQEQLKTAILKTHPKNGKPKPDE